jgi:hypothetical protein
MHLLSQQIHLHPLLLASFQPQHLEVNSRSQGTWAEQLVSGHLHASINNLLHQQPWSKHHTAVPMQSPFTLSCMI